MPAAMFKYDPSLPAFQLINTSGTVVADSRDKILRTTDVLQGSVNFGPHNSAPVDINSNTYLGACNPVSDVVLGYGKFTYPNGDPYGGAPAGDWFSVGGTYVHIYGEGPYFTFQWAAYSFYTSSGSVYVNERVAWAGFTTPTGQVIGWPGLTLTYELWISTFT